MLKRLMEEMISVYGVLKDVCLISSIWGAQTQKGREALLTIMFDEEKDELMEKKMHNVILLCLDNEVLPEVAKY